MEIRKLEKEESIPYGLLLLADPEIEVIKQYLPNSIIYVIELGSTPIAICAVNSTNATTCEIKNLAVTEDKQGQGYGKKMLESVFGSLKEKGYKTILIGTANSSINQLALYQKLGFEIFDLKLNFFVENYDEPVFENGIQCKHMIMLRKEI